MPETTRELRLGICGPVGTGKSSLIMMLCARLGQELEIGVVTNDIYTDEDARFLRSAGVLAPQLRQNAHALSERRRRHGRGAPSARVSVGCSVPSG